jgi:hypothetical protein
MPELCHVLSIDPGGTTGWSILSVAPRVFSGTPEGSLPSLIRHREEGEFEGDPNEQTVQFGELLDAWESAAICIEQFDVRQIAVELSPAYVTAKFEWLIWCEKRDDQIFYQTPGLALGTITDDRLKRWGMYRPGKVHARDALRHSLMFLRRCRENPGLAKEAWPKLLG